MSFSFSFGGDDIDHDGDAEYNPEDDLSYVQAAETGDLRARQPSGAFPIEGQPLLPPTHHDLDSLLQTLPSCISYSLLSIFLDDETEIQLPRRELWDVRIQIMAEDEEDSVEGLGTDDVKTGVYEGGFKSWESSVDVVRVLASRPDVRQGETDRMRVLELGCGTALPSLAILQWFLRNSAGETEALDLGLADYNPTVLRLVTLPNLLLSWAQFAGRLPIECQEGELMIDNDLLEGFQRSLKERHVDLSFFSGAWSPEFVSLIAHKMDEPVKTTTIIGAETIYSPAALRAFATTLMAMINSRDPESTTAIIAAKKVYFGVGGSMQDFCDQVVALGGIVEQLREEEDGVRRAVIEIRRAS